MLQRTSCTLLLAFVVSGAVHAQQTDLNAPTLVLLNGKILTMDGQSRITEAVAIRGGKFLAVGDSATIRSMATSRTRTIDLAGKTVVPGLIDTHAHFKAAGMADYVVNMSRAKTVAEALEAIKQFAAKKKPGDWIIGGAWHPPSQLAEKRYLTRQEIDSIAPNNPVYLRTVGHFSMANTLALARAGVEKGTPNPSGGSFERDASGELTGVLVETAIDHVEKSVPEWTAADEFRQFKIAEGVLNSYGITSAVEGATPARDIATVQRFTSWSHARIPTVISMGQTRRSRVNRRCACTPVPRPITCLRRTRRARSSRASSRTSPCSPRIP